jgi:hypothetical protein
VLCRGQKHDAQMALCESLRMMPCNWAAWQVGVRASKTAVLSSLPGCVYVLVLLGCACPCCQWTVMNRSALLCRRCST